MGCGSAKSLDGTVLLILALIVQKVLLFGRTLTVSGGSLSAATVWGALRGLESFTQLVVFDFEAGSYALEGGATTIVDRPRFVHRGLMIDTARHWQPVASIRGIVDSNGKDCLSTTCQ